MQTRKKGSRGEEVRTLQNKLNVMADGIFGPLTEEALREFQTAHGLEADGVAGPKTWAAMGIWGGAGRRITKIILHCTATPEGRDYTVGQVRAWHKERGFSDVGYHWIVYRDGSVHPGRPESVAGAHCTGQNTCSVGVCYVGGEEPDGSHRPKDTRTPAQKKALRELVAELQKRYPGATVHGHYEFANKACPSFKICDL